MFVFQMPLCALITRSVDPQQTSRRLSRSLATAAAEPHEDDEHVDRLRPRNFIGWLDLADNDARPEPRRKRKFLCRPGQSDWHLLVHIQSFEQPNFGHGTDLTAAASAVCQAAAV